MTRSLLAAVLLLAGCTSGQGAVPDGPPTAQLSMGLSEYRLQASARAVLPGAVTVRVTNAGSARHDVRFRRGGVVLGASRILPPGGVEVLQLQVPAGGPIELDCTVAGHAEAGMVGTLDVEAGGG